MYDQFKRKINYLRISVTDRCNLRCRYCMPEEGVKLLSHSDILSFDEIVEFTRTAVSMGITKVRITGGEPLVRKGIVDLVGMLGSIQGVKDLSMTSNGILLGKYARHLKDAGLNRINISLDTLDPDRYNYITRGGKLSDVLSGIDTVLETGLTPLKINCVIQDDHNEPDARAVKEFAESKGIEIRYIREMSLSGGKFSIVEGGDGGNCAICNRLRLTANGMLKPCLFSNLEFSVRELGNKEAITRALNNKPRCGSINNTTNFYNLGG